MFVVLYALNISQSNPRSQNFILILFLKQLYFLSSCIASWNILRHFFYGVRVEGCFCCHCSYSSVYAYLIVSVTFVESIIAFNLNYLVFCWKSIQRLCDIHHQKSLFWILFCSNFYVSIPIPGKQYWLLWFHSRSWNQIM